MGYSAKQFQTITTNFVSHLLQYTSLGSIPTDDEVHLRDWKWYPHLSLEGVYPNYTIYGSMVEILDIITEKLDTCYEYVFTKDRFFGIEVNGSWTGLMGLLTTRKVDMSGVIFSVTEDRNRAVDFSVPLYTSEHVLCYRKPTFQSDILGFMKPYTLTLWAILLVSMAVICVSLILAQHKRFGAASGNNMGTAGDVGTAVSRIWFLNDAYRETPSIVRTSRPLLHSPASRSSFNSLSELVEMHPDIVAAGIVSRNDPQPLCEADGRSRKPQSRHNTGFDGETASLVKKDISLNTIGALYNECVLWFSCVYPSMSCVYPSMSCVYPEAL
ncbi:glutamate receptor ionotropic, kainate 2-like [Penaeus monodon]|uniref:glutamate receptor ionotropic, kainate 2-like n=1 Tax=Penaeus monodon TaxID=6687 RepID=UPI0018A6DF94|nr:glutamate receptor ionotropic, kainate 2-like [Penaeus monodon]